jgi:peptidoglycan/xylan/chitin deacetylase (PgdA/CDA1 family)
LWTYCLFITLLMGLYLPHNTVFPFYHLICDEKPVHIHHLYPIRSVAVFRKDLEYLLSRYQPLNLQDVMTFVQQGKTRQKPGFFLTFDDGLREIYEVVRPLLLEYGVPAGFFINPAFVDNQDMFFRFKMSILLERCNSLPGTQLKMIRDIFNDNNTEKAMRKVNYNQRIILDKAAEIMEISFADYLIKYKPYMSWAQISHLQQDGFYIGAHSMDHPLYSDISLAEQISQTQQSLDVVQNQLQLDYRIFAFPFTEYGVSQPFFDSIKANILFGTAGMKNDPQSNVIQRIPMEIKDKSAKSIIRSQSVYYMAKHLFNKNTISRL